MIRVTRVRDTSVALGFALLSWFLTARLWPSPTLRTVALNPDDHTLNEWWLAYGARFWVGDFSLVTDRLNFPEGVNLLSNASNIFTAILLGPLTWAFNPSVSYAVLLGANLALTGFGWYLLFSRAVRFSPAAAIVASAFCAFAPGMMSQSIGHVHVTAQWLVPPIVYCVLRLLRGQTPVRTGAVLGLLAAVQLFTGEEVLFLTAFTLGLLTVFLAIFDRQLVKTAWRSFLAGAGTAAGVAGALLAYPLWMQFAGPQHVPNGVFDPVTFSDDLISYVRHSTQSLAGLGGDGDQFATSTAEKNTNFGWPLLLFLAACFAYLWRHRFVRAALPVALLLVGFSLGPEITIHDERTGIPGPYALIQGLPVIDGALPTRFALGLIPLLAAVLGLALHTALEQGGRAAQLVPVGMAIALLPIAPLPIQGADRPPIPSFYTAGHWKNCVRPGGTLLPVPPPSPRYTEPMRWAAATKASFAIPEGFFIGPYGKNGNASLWPPTRPTSQLLHHIAVTGERRVLTESERHQFRDDVGYWKASCVALSPRSTNQLALRNLLEQVYGPGQQIADVLVWQPSGIATAGAVQPRPSSTPTTGDIRQ